MAIVLAHLPGGKELHALHELQPVRFRTQTPSRMPEALIGDDGITQRERLPMRTHARDMTSTLGAEDVPLLGDLVGYGTPQIGVEAEFSRRGSGGGDLTHALLEADGDVPLIPARRRDRQEKTTGMGYSDFARDAGDEVDGEGGEDEADEGEDAEDPEQRLIEAVEMAHDALASLLLAWNRKRRAALAAAGAFD